jgi:hypothetical protein
MPPLTGEVAPPVVAVVPAPVELELPPVVVVVPPGAAVVPPPVEVVPPPVVVVPRPVVVVESPVVVMVLVPAPRSAASSAACDWREPHPERASTASSDTVDASAVRRPGVLSTFASFRPDPASAISFT